MTESVERISYGPVPSRRLGRSLGINNIPPKFCSYSCVYCQLGRTNDLQVRRKRFYDPASVFHDVEERVISVEEMGERIDHLTFVPDGEPTLDINLGKEIEAVKDLGYPVAVVTNSSLLGDEVVRGDLSGADLVSIKVDSLHEDIWRKVNRPHHSLFFRDITEGMKDLSESYQGSMITETMIIGGINDALDTVEATADFIDELDPEIAYITVPIRPPSEKWVEIPSDESMLKVLGIFASKKVRTIPLAEKEYGEFTYTGDVTRDILAITSVHPMREDSVMEMLERSDNDSELIDKMVIDGELTMIEYGGIRFYRRRFR